MRLTATKMIEEIIGMTLVIGIIIARIGTTTTIGAKRIKAATGTGTATSLITTIRRNAGMITLTTGTSKIEIDTTVTAQDSGLVTPAEAA